MLEVAVIRSSLGGPHGFKFFPSDGSKGSVLILKDESDILCIWEAAQAILDAVIGLMGSYQGQAGSARRDARLYILCKLRALKACHKRAQSFYLLIESLL